MEIVALIGIGLAVLVVFIVFVVFIVGIAAKAVESRRTPSCGCVKMFQKHVIRLRYSEGMGQTARI
jgi:hypothetical protein